jgi:hypothetical protein
MQKKNDNEIKKSRNIKMKMFLLCFTEPRTMTDLENIIYPNDPDKAPHLYSIKKEKDWEILFIEQKPKQDKKDKKKYHLVYSQKFFNELLKGIVKNFPFIEKNEKVLKNTFETNADQVLQYTIVKQQEKERIHQRKYYLSSAGFIVMIINKIFFEVHNKYLSEQEAQVLYKLINSKEFRKSTERIVKDTIKKNVAGNKYFDDTEKILFDYLFFVFLIVYIDYNFKNKDKRNYQEKLLKYIGGYQFSNLQNDINKMKKLKILEPDKDDFSISNVPLEILKQTLITITKDFDMNLIKELAMLCPFYYEIMPMLQMFQNVGLKSDKCDFSF